MRWSRSILTASHIPGTIGHVAHGKSTVVKALSGVQTVRFKNELQRNITIKLGYANAKVRSHVVLCSDPCFHCTMRPDVRQIYKCSDCPRLGSYRYGLCLLCPTGASRPYTCTHNTTARLAPTRTMSLRATAQTARASSSCCGAFTWEAMGLHHSPCSHVSFVDCPGHDILMATMLNGAAVMDAALLLIGLSCACLAFTALC